VVQVQVQQEQETEQTLLLIQVTEVLEMLKHIEQVLAVQV
jgi:hypothetical protein